MADIRDCVRSLLPGRARLRHPMLHGLEAESCREVAGMLETIPCLLYTSDAADD